MDTLVENNNQETIEFFDVDIDRKDETFSKAHIDFFMKHLGTDQLVFFTSEDVKYLDNFEFLRIMEIEDNEKLYLFQDEEYNDVFFMSNNKIHFHGLDVCMILNGAVDVLVLRREDEKRLTFEIKDSILIIK